MTKLPTNFSELLAPISMEVFFNEYYGKKPLHIKGVEKKAHGLPNWQGLSDLLNQNSIWDKDKLNLVLDRKMLPPQSYCYGAADGVMAGQVDPDKLMTCLQKGASLVANDIDALTPGLRQIAEILEHKLNGKAQANLYASSRQRQAFNSHFDTHDVFAFHVVGHKRWKVYETRMDLPIRHRRHSNDAYNQDQHQQQRGKVLLDVFMEPGDLLYLPRGQYHDALASEGGAIHVAFGVTSVIGLDVYQMASDFLLEQALFRQNLPRQDEGKVALKKFLLEMAKHYQKLCESEEFLNLVSQYQAQYHYKRGGVSLPVEVSDQKFNHQGDFEIVTIQGKTALKSNKGAVQIPPDRIEVTKWVIARKTFNRFDFMDAFAHLPANDCDQYLLEFQSMGVLGMGVIGKEN